MQEEMVILVDDSDTEIGLSGKLQAHQDGVLHRAVSVFVFNSKKQLLIQQRAMHKYHSPGIWANTCCTHPRKNESNAECAHRRLREEMGFDCDLDELFSFVYMSSLDRGLTEHEYDHVFIGFEDAMPVLNPKEVQDAKWIALSDLQSNIAENPSNYAPWLQKSLPEVIKHTEDFQL